MKVLITGADGLVGTYLTPLLRSQYNTFALHHSGGGAGSYQADLLKTEELLKILGETKPQTIVNLAAMTDVDLCETERDMALRLNRDTVITLCDYVRENGGYLVQISTDYIFDGQSGDYKEESITNPINWYGKTKLLAELEVTSRLESGQWCIARTSSIFGMHDRKLTFPFIVARKLYNKQKIMAFKDQYSTPTYARNLAEMIVDIVARRIHGIIHTAGATRISRFEQARMLATLLGFDEKLVEPTTVNDMVFKAARPKDSSLNVDKATRILGSKPQSYLESCELFAKEIEKNPVSLRT